MKRNLRLSQLPNQNEEARKAASWKRVEVSPPGREPERGWQARHPHSSEQMQSSSAQVGDPSCHPGNPPQREKEKELKPSPQPNTLMSRTQQKITGHEDPRGWGPRSRGEKTR